MYNRYVPQSDGSFRRNRITDPSPSPQPPPIRPAEIPPVSPQKSCNQEKSAENLLSRLLPKDFNTEDLLVILLLLLMSGEHGKQRSNALLTLMLYFFL